MISLAYIVDVFGQGGLERCVARLVNGLDAERYRPIIVCLTESGGAAEWIGRSDVPIYELQKRPGNDWRVIKRLADVIKREQVDVVHSHNWGTLVETVLARRWAKTPVHVHAQRGMFHHGKDAAAWKQAARRVATRWACSRANAVVAVADSVRDDLISTWGVSADSIEVIPNGVSIPEHDASGARGRELRRSLGIDEQAIVVSSVGRLVPVKDFGALIGAVGKLASHENGAAAENLHLVIVGGGPEMAALEEIKRASGVADRIHFVGQQSNVGDWLSAMDVYVNCSLSEGMSQSILEAMSMGLPMVVTDVGENAVLVGGEDGCGSVVSSGNVSGLAGAIAEMCSPVLRKSFGERAISRHRSRYSLSTMLSSYEEFYEHLISSVSRPIGDSRITSHPFSIAPADSPTR